MLHHLLHLQNKNNRNATIFVQMHLTKDIYTSYAYKYALT